MGEEITDIVTEIISLRNLVLSAAEQQRLITEICDDVLGLGPLEPLLARDDIADIMVNGAKVCYIETEGKMELTEVKFRDNTQLMNICQPIVSAVGRRVDESSPICDARLLDGSRVNVIAPPLAIDGACLTIRKFKKDKLKLADLINFGAITPAGGKLLGVIGACRLNILISGGTGSGKTTLLNALTGFIDIEERTITCGDSAELQLQQPHVVRLETRPPNLEGVGEITMRDLIKNCLRMRPERIIVGEVRGPEAFDLLQAAETRRGRSRQGLLARGRLRHGLLPRRRGQAPEDPLSRPHAGERQAHAEGAACKRSRTHQASTPRDRDRRYRRWRRRQLDLPGDPVARNRGDRLLACLRTSANRVRPCRGARLVREVPRYPPSRSPWRRQGDPGAAPPSR